MKQIEVRTVIRKTLLILILSLLLCGSAIAQRSDADIRSDLQRRIPAGASVSTAVQSGVVTVTGTVRTLAQELGILNMARRTVGVRQVVDRITVTPAERRSDEEIRRAVRETLSGNLSSSELSAITINVQNGIVTFTGTLPTSYPKQLATTLASFVPGVTGIRNEILVRPPRSRPDAEILLDVRNKFDDNPFIPENRINVTVAGGVVTLAGTVENFLQAEQAESIARFTPGVVDVRNNLFVQGR